MRCTVPEQPLQIHADVTHCGKGPAAASGATISLPVLPSAAAKPRTSRLSYWRAGVLILVNVLIVAHIIQWLIMGRTIAPVEPSESMRTLEFGEINPGFVFFSLALLSTFLFGRFVCGWGCHVIALQDLCTWMLGKMRIKAKPFRSRLLLLAPSMLALYMFVWPMFKRAVLFPLLDSMKITHPIWLDRPPAITGITTHFIVEDFWATFPPWYMAIPFLLVCGFACVYFLGNKGFCTYGCPYGGFFAPLDKLSIGCIVVDDNCHQCGHCTATCTSNVRVHQEVRDFGMVVDPGCMKCLDCVSVCPNGALSFSFGKPAAFAKPLLGGTVAIAGRGRPPYDLTLAQDLILFVLGIGLFLSFRGLLDSVPLLMAAGLASIGVYALAKLWQGLTQPSVRIQNLQLKVKGRFTVTGGLIVLLGVAYLGLGVWGGVVNYHRWQGDLGDQAIVVPFATVFSPGYKPAPADKAMAEAAIRHLEIGGERAHGGIGWKHLPKTLVRLSWLHAVACNLPAAEQYLTQAIDEGKPGPDWIFGLARLYMLQDKPAMLGKELYERTLVKHPHMHDVRLALAQLELQTSNGLKAGELLQVMLADVEEPPLPHQYVRATELLIDCGYQNRALEAMQAAASRKPKEPIFLAGLATTQFYAADPADAIETMKKAVALEPANVAFLNRLSQMYEAMGDPIQAGLARQRAETLMRDQQASRGAK